MHCTCILFEVDSVSETMKNDFHKLKFITALLLRSDGKMPLYSKNPRIAFLIM